MFKRTINNLLAKYREGMYECPTPKVDTYQWCALDWVAYINKHGRWLNRKPALTGHDVMTIVGRCSYKPGWRVDVHGDLFDGSMYLQVSVAEDVGRCSVSGKPTAWKSGKRYLSKHMCHQEVVGVVFALIKAAEEHEMLEWFRYKGASIFNPHLDPNKLAELARYADNFVTRPDNRSMTQEED